MIKASLFFALAGLAATPAIAQTGPTLSAGRVLRIAPDGATSTVVMPSDQNMQSAMKKRAKKVTKGLVVWMDEKNQMFYLTDPVNSSWSTGEPMTGK